MRDNCKNCGEHIDDKQQHGYCSLCVEELNNEYDDEAKRQNLNDSD